MSPHHLLRLFKLVNGCTPREYLQAKRTRVAARLIASTDLTLEEIAHRVGFEDRSTLGRQLRRMYGTTPRQLRGAAPSLLPLAQAVRATALPAHSVQSASGAAAPAPSAQSARVFAPPSEAAKGRSSAPMVSPRSKARPRSGATRDALAE
jgi:AraC-like DNA-binding protein